MSKSDKKRTGSGCAADSSVQSDVRANGNHAIKDRQAYNDGVQAAQQLRSSFRNGIQQFRQQQKHT